MILKDIISNLGDHTTDAILIAQAEPLVLPGPRVVWCNRAFTEMTGYAPEEIIGSTPRILQGPQTDVETRSRISRQLKSWQTVRAQLLNYRKDKTTFWVDLNIKPVADDNGWYRYWVAIQRDVTEQRNNALRLEAANRLLERQRMILDHSKDVALVTDGAGLIEWVNPAFTSLTGYTLDEVRGYKPGDVLQGPDTDPTAVAAIARALQAGEQIEIVIKNYSKAGRSYWVDMSIVPVRENGEVINFIAIERDITVKRDQEIQLRSLVRELESRNDQVKQQNAALKSLTQKIEHDALHDPVTGLPGRSWLAWAYGDPARPEKSAPQNVDAFCAVDIDEFYLVNDAYGHDVGDEVLRRLAARFVDVAGPGSAVVRLPGDEFAIVGSFGPADEQIVELGERIQACIREPIHIDGQSLTLSGTVGLSRVAGFDIGLAEAEKHADAALRFARQLDRRLVLYSDEVAQRVGALRRFARDFPRAFAVHEFVPYFQVQVNARTHALAGVETLMRWHHPTRGVLLPAEFLPSAAALKLLDKIDDDVVERAVAQFERLISMGISPPKMSINLRAARLMDRRYVAWLIGLNERIGCLSVELLETSIADDLHNAVLGPLIELRRAGIGIEIDDFGTGRASIMSLIRLRPDRIKIDRGMVPRNHDDKDRMEAVTAMVILARTEGAGTTAEGVENSVQARTLAELGVDTLQGFHFGRPSPAERIEQTMFRGTGGNVVPAIR